MARITLYSTLLLLGIILSQFVDMLPLQGILRLASLALLAYIMIEVGLELQVDKSNLKGYGKDYLVAMTAAAFPWIFCSLYFWLFFESDLPQAAIIGRFAAPTSAGILFSMLGAAGLASTWVFKKARILAIFDDLDTVLLMIPLQMLYLGFEARSLVLIGILGALLYLAWRYLHVIRLPTGRLYLVLYAALLTAGLELFDNATHLNLEILLPAFVLGCLLKNPHSNEDPTFLAPQASGDKLFDSTLKGAYMLLVGCSLPKIAFSKMALSSLALHVLAITLLANLGKLYPLFYYKKEASLCKRAALSIALWPRGEVGAGILLLSMKYSLLPTVIEVAELSLSLNLILTGLFIYCVVLLLKKESNLARKIL
jgi:Kef-type K+ transport system membrane component KefB